MNLNKKTVIEWFALMALLIALAYVAHTVFWSESPPVDAVPSNSAPLEANVSPVAVEMNDPAPAIVSPLPELPSDTEALARLANGTTDVVQLARIQQILRYRESISKRIGGGGDEAVVEGRQSDLQTRQVPAASPCAVPPLRLLHLNFGEGPETAIVEVVADAADIPGRRLRLGVGSEVGRYRVKRIDQRGLLLATAYCPEPVAVASGW